MEKKIKEWSIKTLEEQHSRISFPEYQREPNIWSRAAKQRLIDSVARHFDIASLYLYEDNDGSLECIDGRQRIAAIMSFLGKNLSDADNSFPLKTSNEIYLEEAPPFRDLDGASYDEICRRAEADVPAARLFIKRLEDYTITVVHLSGSTRPEEFNLQFTRLNLGVIINSGEKLNAMFGEMRTICFDRLGQHAFLEVVSIPTRRFSKEQVAAQIVAQVFSLKSTGKYTRTRHFDLQKFFKDEQTLDPEKRSWVEEIAGVLDGLSGAFAKPGLLRNRAITVSVALQAWRGKLVERGEVTGYAEFVEEFLCRLKWQVEKGLGVDREYHYLIEFQRHVTQASVEKPAVEARATLLDREYDIWRASKRLTGDLGYQTRIGRDPADDCRQS